MRGEREAGSDMREGGSDMKGGEGGTVACGKVTGGLDNKLGDPVSVGEGRVRGGRGCPQVGDPK